MRSSVIRLMLAAATVAGFASCYTPRYMYSPNAVNVPNLEKKGDSKLAGYFSFGNNGTNNGTASNERFYNHGFDLQAAYAVTNHFALMYNHSSRYERNSGEFNGLFDSAVVRYQRRFNEFGVGYFNRFGKRKTGAIFQVFAGYGFGNFSFNDNGRDNALMPYYRFHEADVTRFFIQPSVIADLSKNFITSLVNRFSIVSFRNVRTSYTASEQESFLLNDLEGRTAVFWEPAFVNNINFPSLPGLRFELQVGFASLVSRKFIDYRTANFSVGVVADMRKLFLAKKPR
jgi:hypothetical protein